MQGHSIVLVLYAKWKDLYKVTLSLDSPENWDDLGGNIAVVFSKGELRQTAIFSQSMPILEYTGYPNAGDTNGIAILSAGVWAVKMYLPSGYTYEIFKDGAAIEDGMFTMEQSDATDCIIEVRIHEGLEQQPWGKQIYKSIGN